MAKKALLVGLNATPTPRTPCRGCINDVRQVSDLLHSHFGFGADGSIRLLTDARATTAAIVDRLHWLLDGARPGDVLVFHYSGHGSQVPDRHGDELDDGLDEIICPYDLDWDNPFTDDDLYAHREGPAGGSEPDGGARLLPFRHGPARGGRPRSAGAEPVPAAAPRHRSRQRRTDLAVRRFGSRAAERGAILIAGCRSDQVSADAYIDGDYHGALTYYLCKALAGLQARSSAIAN